MLFYSKAITSVKLSYKLMFVFIPACVDDILESSVRTCVVVYVL